MIEIKTQRRGLHVIAAHVTKQDVSISVGFTHRGARRRLLKGLVKDNLAGIHYDDWRN